MSVAVTSALPRPFQATGMPGREQTMMVSEPEVSDMTAAEAG